MQYNIKEILDNHKLNYIIDSSNFIDVVKYKIKFNDTIFVIITVLLDDESNFIYSIFTGENREYFVTNYEPMEKIVDFVENIQNYIKNKEKE